MLTGILKIAILFSCIAYVCYIFQRNKRLKGEVSELERLNSGALNYLFAATVVFLVISITLGLTLRSNYIRGVENLHTLTEEAVILKNKNGELYTKQQSLVLKQKELEALNIGLAEEVSEYKEKLKAALSTTLTVTDTIINIVTVEIPAKQDSLSTEVSFSDSLLQATFQLDYHVTPLTFSKFNYTLSIPLFAAFEVRNNKSYVLLSSSPNVRFSNTQAFVVPELVSPRKRRFGLGLQAGISSGYDLFSKTPFVGPSISIGLSYNFVTF